MRDAAVFGCRGEGRVACCSTLEPCGDSAKQGQETCAEDLMGLRTRCSHRIVIMGQRLVQVPTELHLAACGSMCSLGVDWVFNVSKKNEQVDRP